MALTPAAVLPVICTCAQRWASESAGRAAISVPVTVSSGNGRPGVITASAPSSRTTRQIHGRSAPAAVGPNGVNIHGRSGRSNSACAWYVAVKSSVPGTGKVRITCRVSIPVTSPGPSPSRAMVPVWAGRPVPATLTPTCSFVRRPAPTDCGRSWMAAARPLRSQLRKVYAIGLPRLSREDDLPGRAVAAPVGRFGGALRPRTPVLHQGVGLGYDVAFVGHLDVEVRPAESGRAGRSRLGQRGGTGEGQLVDSRNGKPGHPPRRCLVPADAGCGLHVDHRLLVVLARGDPGWPVGGHPEAGYRHRAAGAQRLERRAGHPLVVGQR